MQIVCATTSAAAQVFFVLMDAQLRPGHDFHLAATRPPDPPITFMFMMDLPADVVHQLQCIRDITIAGARA